MPKVSEEEARAMQHYLVKKCQTDPPKTANERQVGGDHYKTEKGEQHWDMMWRLFREAWFVGAVTKYILRYRKKDGLKDLHKARHYLDKLIELEEADQKEAMDAMKRDVAFHHQPAPGEIILGTCAENKFNTPVRSWVRCYFCTQMVPELVDTVKGPMCEQCYSSHVSAGTFKNHESGKE